MDGVFVRSKLSVIMNILGIFSGIILIAMLPFSMIVDDIMTFATTFGLAFFAFFGLIVVILCTASLFFNRGAYLHLSDDGISSRFSWASKLECSYSDIAFCEYGINALTIRLKTGKGYMIFNLLNAADICGEIRKKITRSDESDCSSAQLYDEVHSIKKQRTKWLWFTCFFCLMMLLVIVLTVLLTGGKDLSEFSRNDWIVFLIFAIFELLDVVVTFFFANKCGKLNPVLNEKSAALKKQILKDAPLPSGNLLKVYMNTDYTARAVVFGYPNIDDVYFIVQAVDKNFNVITTYLSEVYSSMEELQPMLDELIQIA